MAVHSANSMSDEPRSSYSNPPSTSRAAVRDCVTESSVRAPKKNHAPKNNNPRQAHHHHAQENTGPDGKPKKAGWGQRLRQRLFGNHPRNRKNTNNARRGAAPVERHASVSSLSTGTTNRRTHMQKHSRNMSTSALTHSSAPMYEQDDDNYATSYMDSAPATSQSYAGTSPSARHFPPSMLMAHSSSAAAAAAAAPSPKKKVHHHQSYFAAAGPSSSLTSSSASNPQAFHSSYFSPSPNHHRAAASTSMSARDFRQPMNSYAYNQEDESYANFANQAIDEDLEVSYFNA